MAYKGTVIFTPIGKLDTATLLEPQGKRTVVLHLALMDDDNVPANALLGSLAIRSAAAFIVASLCARACPGTTTEKEKAPPKRGSEQSINKGASMLSRGA